MSMKDAAGRKMYDRANPCARRPRKAPAGQTIKQFARELIRRIDHTDADKRNHGLDYNQIRNLILAKFPKCPTKGPHYLKPTRISFREIQAITCEMNREGARLPFRPRRKWPRPRKCRQCGSEFLRAPFPNGNAQQFCGAECVKRHTAEGRATRYARRRKSMSAAEVAARRDAHNARRRAAGAARREARNDSTGSNSGAPVRQTAAAPAPVAPEGQDA